MGGKWGYRLGTNTIITPQYDTAFAFAPGGAFAMVGNRRVDRTEIDPLTGEERQSFDYYFIRPDNTKLVLVAGKDSTSVFPDQQELCLNYLYSAPVFKVLYGKKVWLFAKNGRQLSGGYDDIYAVPDGGRFYITESYNEWEKEIVRVKGLIDTSGKQIVNCEKRQIHINTEDSLIYTCSTVFNRRLSDEVFDYDGNVVYSNKNHIEFAAKKIFVYRLFEPKELFMVSNGSKDLFGVEGEHFYPLKDRMALVTGASNWFLVNLQTGKKQRVNNGTVLTLSLKLASLWI